jgi:2-polyprenyl-6-methoxyphenol hydroxylase-like FAD-dependent oxidoreductase
MPTGAYSRQIGNTDAKRRAMRRPAMHTAGSRAVVLGAGMSGLLSARVLADCYESVTVLERDQLPDQPRHRKGVPQGRHLHQFLTRGTQVLGELFPGILDELVDAGAIINDPSRIYTRFGRYELCCTGTLADPQALRYYQASRPFMEFHVRRRVAALGNVTFLDGHEVVDLVTTADAVTGVRTTNCDTGAATILNADLVVDALGRASRTPDFLQRNGFGSPPVKHAAAAWAYSSQLMNIPHGQIAQRMASIVDHASTATRLLLLGYEHNTWILAVGHPVGQGEPPTRFAEMLSTAERFMPTTIMTGLRCAAPLGDIAVFRNTAATWRRYDHMPRYPAGVVVIGDALCTLDPIWGQGMTMAAVQALTLRDCLRTGDPDLPRRFFSAAAGHIGPTWAMNQANDRIPLADGDPGALRHRISKWATDAALSAATSDVTLTERLFRVANLIDPPSRLQDPALLPRIFLANLRHARGPKTT